VLLIVRFLQLMAALLLLRLFVRFVAAFLQGLRAPDKPQPAPGEAADLVRDRVCNTFVPRAGALVARVGGHQEHFCSAACRDKAIALLKAS
jgi:hypothetical protein